MKTQSDFLKEGKKFLIFLKAKFFEQEKQTQRKGIKY